MPGRIIQSLRRAESLKQLLDRPAKLVFAGLVLATFWQNREALLASALVTGLAIVLLNFGGIVMALSTRLLPGISGAQATAIAIETGLQNAAIAIFVCSALLGKPGLAVPALVYAVVMNVTALVLVAASRLHAGRATAAEDRAARSEA
jgi:BASS family bile acid:Na+ symporter